MITVKKWAATLYHDNTDTFGEKERVARQVELALRDYLWEMDTKLETGYYLVYGETAPAWMYFTLGVFVAVLMGIIAIAII